MSDDRITTIKLRVSTRDRLKALGRKGDTYEDVILKMLDAKE